MTFEQTVNGLLPTLLLPPGRRPAQLGLAPAVYYALHREVERRCLAELSRRNAPDEVLAGAAADQALSLLPRLAAKYDPAVGSSFAAYVDGVVRKVCPRYARRYYREHAPTGGRPLDARPSGGPSPADIAIVHEALATVRRTRRRAAAAGSPRPSGRLPRGVRPRTSQAALPPPPAVRADLPGEGPPARGAVGRRTRAAVGRGPRDPPSPRRVAGTPCGGPGRVNAPPARAAPGGRR